MNKKRGYSRDHPKQSLAGPKELNLTTGKIRVSRVVAEHVDSNVVRGRIKIPANLPILKEILSVGRSVNIYGLKICKGLLLYEGAISVEISYRAQGSGSIQKFCTAVAFHDFIDIPDAPNSMTAVIKAEVEEIKCSRLDQQREIILDFVIVTKALLKSIEEIELPVEAPPYCQALKEELVFNELVYSARCKLQLSEDINISSANPAVKEITGYTAVPILQNYGVDVGSVMINGWLKLNIYYLNDSGENCHLQRFIPYSKLIAVPRAVVGSLADVQFLSQRTNIKINNANGRCLQLHADTEFLVNVFQLVKQQVITAIDAGDVKYAQRDLNLENLAASVKAEAITSDTAVLPAEFADAQIKEMRVGPVEITTAKVVNNLILMRGSADFLACLVTQGEQIKHVHRQVSFKTTALLKEREYFTRVETMPQVNRVTGEMINGCLKIYADINVEVRLFNLKKYCLPTDVGSINRNADKEQRIYFIYRTQPGDTLEKLAWRFGTSTDAILDLNPELERGESLIQQKIRIPCEAKS